MSKTKSQQVYDLLKQNQAQLYHDFAKIHRQFAADPETHRAKFNNLGRDFISIVRTYERRLCGSMERTNHSVYSTGVSEKFWSLIRAEFPQIDQVGLITKKA